MKRIIPFYLLLLTASVSFGQIEKILNPADLKQQTIVTEPLSLRKGFLRVGFTYSYSVLDKYFDDSARKHYFPESTWGTSTSTMLWTQYGISDRIMVELGIPYSNDLTNYFSTRYAPEINSMMALKSTNRGKGIGDIILSGTYQIIPSADNNFSFKAALDITVPTGEKNPTNLKSTGSYDAPTGYGVFVFSPRLTVRMVTYPFSYGAYMFYDYNLPGSRLMSPGAIDETKFTYGNFFVTGGNFNLHLNEWIALANELNYSHRGKGKIDGTPSSDLSIAWGFSYETRLIFQIKRFRLGEAVTFPLKGKNIGADPTYVLIGQYVF
jgi:hypothetical protein